MNVSTSFHSKTVFLPSWQIRPRLEVPIASETPNHHFEPIGIVSDLCLPPLRVNALGYGAGARSPPTRTLDGNEGRSRLCMSFLAVLKNERYLDEF